MFINVDLPEPEGPITATKSPLSMCRSTWSSAWTQVSPTWNRRHSCCVLIMDLQTRQVQDGSRLRDVDPGAASAVQVAGEFGLRLGLAVHQENLELVRVGVFNDWVQRSLDELAVLMPARYAKSELSSGFVGTIDQYAYHSPLTPESEDQAADQEVTIREAAEPAEELAGVSHVQN